MPHLKFFLPLSLCFLMIAAAELLACNGGGTTLAGLDGEYYATNDLSGPVSFTRKDVRIDFDWSSMMAPGGSIAEPYASFPKDNYSIRWEGQIIPAFSESYTFRVFANDGARLYLKPEGSPTWTTVIDAWTGASGTWSSGGIALTEGTVYDIRLEYRELTGAAAIRLYWLAPSFPEEVVDPLADVGSNVTHWTQVFADIVKDARNSWNAYNGQPTPGTDADGWPDTDFSYTFQESLNEGLGLDPLMRGTVAFRFNGRGTPSVSGNVDGDSITSSYDAGINTTSGTFTTVDKNKNASSFRVANTDRDGNYGGDGQPDQDGVTNLQLMCPVAPDATTSFPFDTLFLPQIRQAYEHFTVLRSNLNNGNQERFWSDRTLPGYFNQARGRALDRVYSNPDYGLKRNGASWEHKILLCNETGRDLYVNIPHMATGWDLTDTTSYVYKLAQLIRYGSDGVEPYSSPQANPVYPPLNPNLRVYVELSNEVWNFGGDAFRQYWDIDAMTTADADAALVGGVTDPLARPQDFPIINYDNLSTAKDSGSYNSLGTWRFRKVMLRTIQISDIFRLIFGSSSMHTRIRPMYEWQYANTNNTAYKGLVFAEEYFNNGDGMTHVVSPYPVNHYLWGGGGASYYGSSNGWAVTDILFDPSFEDAALPTGYNQAPAHADWNFTGTAGIAVDAGETDDIPPPWEGVQMAYIEGTGEISIDVTFPSNFRSDVFAVGFKALNRLKTGATESDAHKVQVFFDGVPINARSYSQSNGYVPILYDSDKPWISRVVFWTDSEYYSTETFNVLPDSTHTIAFKGVGDADDALFLEDVRITHVDAIFDGNMPAGGSAAGQVNSTTYLLGLDVQNDWATAYGLKHITYEGGWSLGGDTGGSPIQNIAKFGSAEAADVNERSLDFFHRAGGAVNTLGTYAQWPSWRDNYAVEGLLDLANNPLFIGQLAFLSKLPVPSTNGTGVPNRLLIGDAHLGLDTNISGATATLDAAGKWISWHMLAPQRGDYTLDLTASGDADFVVESNGEIVATFNGSGSLTPMVLDLLAGQNGLRIRSLGGGSLTITDILVENPDFTSAPAFSPRGGSFEYPVTISLSSETPGANIRYTLDGSDPTTTHGTLYASPFLVSTDTDVRAIAYATGLNPSVVVSEFYQPAGAGAFLAVWDFAGDGGVTSSLPEYNATGDASVIASIGPGLNPINYIGNGLTATKSTAMTLQEAIDGDDYISIVLNAGGQPFSITGIDFHPVSQNRSRTFTLFSSNDGFTTSDAINSVDYHGNNGSNEPFYLAIAGHENLTGPVELRFYVHGFDNQFEAVGFGNHTGLDLMIYGNIGTVLTPFQTWAGGYGVPVDPSSDDDKDGLSLLMEYALNANPTLTEIPANMPDLATSDGHSFTFPRFPDRTDVDYVVEVSDNLSGWSDAAQSLDGSATTPLSPDFLIDTSGSNPVQTTITHQNPPNPVFWRLTVRQ